MKTSLIILSILLALFIIMQSFVKKSTSSIEMYPYEVLKTYDDFEVRQYAPSNFSYVTMNSKSYKESSSAGFRMLAGYIFGGNAKNEKIAMTSPVTMNLGDSISMQFLIPAEYSLDELPTPNDTNVKFKRESAKTVAAISFNGWANDEKIKEYTTKLEALLQKHQIKHNKNFSYLGYNPPFELINRRNEIIVEVDANNL